MSVQVILVPTYGRGCDRDLLRHAGVLAERLRARVDVTFVDPGFPTIPVLIDESLFGALAAGEIIGPFDTVGSRLTAALNSYDHWRGQHGRGAVTWRTIDADTSLMDIARLADITIVPLVAAGRVGPGLAFISELLRRSGRPVLAIPNLSFPEPKPIDTVLVGWDGGRSAIRTVDGALPILKNARRVVVANVDARRERAGAQAETLQTYLDRHGIASTILLPEATRLPVHDVLRQAAQAESADLMVIGAGNGVWWRQVRLGGTARRILAAATVPVLMAV